MVEREFPLINRWGTGGLVPNKATKKTAVKQRKNNGNLGKSTLWNAPLINRERTEGK